MKKNLLTFTAIVLMVLTSTYGQSTLIIDENFQDWEGTEDTAPEACADGLVHENEVTRAMDIVTSTGTEEITVTMIKCGIDPNCDSRRAYDGGGSNTEGVTTGWVSLNKLGGEYNTVDDFEQSTDTIGQFIFGPVPQIDSIRFAHSATGGNRGIRIYMSTDGEIWTRPSENEYWDGSDSQAGDVNVAEIYQNDVYIKFTAGFKQSDGTSQYSRLHNIEVWGTPGELSTGITGINPEKLLIKPLGENLYRVEGNVKGVRVYNTIGNVINMDYNANNNILNLSSAPAGIYIIKANSENGKQFVQKVYKQ